MGNEQEINNNAKRTKRLRDRNVRTIASDEEDSDQDDDQEKEQKNDEYDNEISKMLFDEEAELDEGERLKKIRKKMNQKEELKSYAQQIAEEQFMEEINRSKSVNKLPIGIRGRYIIQWCATFHHPFGPNQISETCFQFTLFQPVLYV